MPFHQDATYWNLHHTDERAVSLNLPHTVVVWLAFTDVDESNAALQVIPGSHMHALPHVPVDGEQYVLNQAVDPGVLERCFTPADRPLGRSDCSKTLLKLRAGEISIHDCRKHELLPTLRSHWKYTTCTRCECVVCCPPSAGIAHGSDANNSERLRCGLNMTFSATDVTGDAQVPRSETFGGNWEIYMARGVDRYGHNPHGQIPQGEDVPTNPGGAHSSLYHQ